MADVNEILEGIKDDVLELVTKEAKEHVAEARQDAEAVARALAGDLTEWITQLAGGELSKEEFDFLVRGRKSVIKMAALSDKGLAKARIERIVNGVIDIIITAAAAM